MSRTPSPDQSPSSPGDSEDTASDSQNGDAARGLLLPTTRTTERKNTDSEQSYAKCYLNTFLVYEESFRHFLKEVKPWTEFHEMAINARDRWLQYLDANEMPKSLPGFFKEVRHLLTDSDIRTAARLKASFITSLMPIARVGRVITRSNINLYEGFLAHIKTVGEAQVLYDREHTGAGHFENSKEKKILGLHMRGPQEGLTSVPLPDGAVSAEQFSTCIQEEFVQGQGTEAFRAMMCCVLYEMIHTDSWVMKLTTHNESVFLKGEARDGGLTLFTSSIYTPDGREHDGITSLHGILSLLLKFSGTAAPPRLEKERTFMGIMDRAATGPREPAGSSDEDRTSGETGSADEMQVDTPGVKRARVDKGVIPAKRRRISENRAIQLQSGGQAWNESDWSIDQDELVLSLLRKTPEFYNSEWTIARMADINGTRVVLKHWNGGRLSGLDRILSQAKIWDRLWRDHRDVIGSAIPPLVALRREPEEQTTIVTEYVGYEVMNDFDEDGCTVTRVRVGSEVVPREELPGLIRAGERALSQLHAIGISPMRLECENIRAARHVRDNVCVWRVWLLDMAEASINPRADELKSSFRYLRNSLGWGILGQRERDQDQNQSVTT